LTRHSRPYVNYGLILVNAIVFIYELFLNSTGTTAFFYRWGLIPAELAHGIEYTTLRVGVYQTVDIEAKLFGMTVPAWGTAFTSMFVHGGFMHFIGNMVFLWVFGDDVEDKLGHVKYLLFYLGCGLAAAWTQIAINMDSQTPTVGASGAIAGALGAYLVLYPYSRINTMVVFVFLTVVRLPAIWLLGVWFIMQLFSGVGSLGPDLGGGGVAYWAHVGGFVAGMLLIALYLLLRHEPILPWRRRTPWVWARDDSSRTDSFLGR
jgi:membrane associated rhomboid family serine protease